MRKLSRIEKFNVLKAGVTSYTVCSLIAWLKNGGLQFINTGTYYAIKIHKTWGVIDVFTLHGKLKDMKIFDGDWIFLVVGMGTSFFAMGAMKIYYWIKDPSQPTVEKTPKGVKVCLTPPAEKPVEEKSVKVKLKKSLTGPIIREFEL